MKKMLKDAFRIFLSSVLLINTVSFLAVITGNEDGKLKIAYSFVIFWGWIMFFFGGVWKVFVNEEELKVMEKEKNNAT